MRPPLPLLRLPRSARDATRTARLLRPPPSPASAPGPGLCLRKRTTASFCLRPVCRHRGGQAVCRGPAPAETPGSRGRGSSCALTSCRWLTAAPPPVTVAAWGPDPRAGVFKRSSSRGVSLSVHTWSLTQSPGRDPLDAEKLSFLKTSDQPASRLTGKSSPVFRVPTCDPPSACTPASVTRDRAADRTDLAEARAVPWGMRGAPLPSAGSHPGPTAGLGRQRSCSGTKARALGEAEEGAPALRATRPMRAFE